MSDLIEEISKEMGEQILKMWQQQERSLKPSSEQSMSLDILRELALVLRWMQARGLAVQFETYRSDVSDE